MRAQPLVWFERVSGWWQATTPGQVWACYGRSRAALLAGGIAYAGFFSMFPALALAFAVLGLVADSSLDLRSSMADAVNSTVGLQVIGAKGIVTIDTLLGGGVLATTGLLGLLLLTASGLGWVAAMREGIRGVFELNGGTNMVVDKLFDLAALILIGTAVLASMAATIGQTMIPGGGGGRFLLQLLVDLVLIGFDSIIFLLLFRWLGRVPRRVGQLYPAALGAAVGMFALKVGGSLVLRWASGNRFLASLALIIGLLLWFNLVARLTLLCAAWAATTTEAPVALVTAMTTEARGIDPPPSISVRSQDRVTLAAGAVLGAVTIAALGMARRAVVTVIRGGPR